MSRHGEANVCETRADAQEPAAQTRRLAATVGVSSAPRSASSRSEFWSGGRRRVRRVHVYDELLSRQGYYIS